MKTQLNQIPLEFNPIEVKITLENAEELKNFLILTSCISSPEFWRDEYYNHYTDIDGKSSAQSLIKFDRLTSSAQSLIKFDRLTSSAQELTKFGDDFISDDQWNTLSQIHKKYA
jgi:hypothetical protein